MSNLTPLVDSPPPPTSLVARGDGYATVGGRWGSLSLLLGGVTSNPNSHKGLAVSFLLVRLCRLCPFCSVSCFRCTCSLLTGVLFPLFVRVSSLASQDPRLCWVLVHVHACFVGFCLGPFCLGRFSPSYLPSQTVSLHTLPVFCSQAFPFSLSFLACFDIPGL